MKTLTVFTPTYNRAHTLERLYKSLCAQTCQDFDWLVIDDGSTDGTAALVQGFNLERKRLRPLLQASRYRGCPVSFQEAFALGKTAIATSFPTVNSSIQDGENGHVVPLDNEGCAREIIACLYQS